MQSGAKVETVQPGRAPAKEGFGEDEGGIFALVVVPSVEMRILGFVQRTQAEARKKRHRPAEGRQRPDDVRRVALQMQILDARRVRKHLVHRLAGQSDQRRLLARRTAFLLRRGRRGAHAEAAPLVRFLARHGRRGRSDIDGDVSGDVRRALQEGGDPLWRQVRREGRPELLEVQRDGAPALADVRERDPGGSEARIARLDSFARSVKGSTIGWVT